ncbi:hypothetical protein V8C26DRAFT_358237, partial [Trichoderma gracile]
MDGGLCCVAFFASTRKVVCVCVDVGSTKQEVWVYVLALDIMSLSSFVMRILILLVWFRIQIVCLTLVYGCLRRGSKNNKIQKNSKPESGGVRAHYNHPLDARSSAPALESEQAKGHTTSFASHRRASPPSPRLPRKGRGVWKISN